MKNKKNYFTSIYIVTYVYLCLPVAIFLLGWCRWYIGIPAIMIVVYSLAKCIKERSNLKTYGFELKKQDICKLLLALLFIAVWVWLSGVGKFVWQNSDHTCRNTIYELLVNHSWPVRGEYAVEGVVQSRGMVYYIGFWLPAALIGKALGIRAGYVSQYVWAVLGIFLLYLLICLWRKKVLIWPLLLLAMFSGLDIVGTFMLSDSMVRIFGIEHLERWPGVFQFSGMTTQLFWVYNQAIPAWVAAILIFIDEKPKNIIFICSLIMLTSTFPFIGILPYAVYYMIIRSEWKRNRNIRNLLINAVQNFCSVQNVLGGGCIGIVSFLYLIGNISGVQGNLMTGYFTAEGNLSLSICLLIGIILVIGAAWLLFELYLKGYRKTVYGITSAILIAVCGFLIFINISRIVGIGAQLRRLLLFILFYFLEAGVYLLCLYKRIGRKSLFWLNTIWLFTIPNIVVGYSIDFCMRASIPGLFLIIIWCIEALDKDKRKISAWILIALLSLGSVTSIHEICRTVINTVNHESVANESEETIMTAGNFSGNTENIFWKFIAR